MRTGERIKQLRKEKHISAEEIAAAAEVSPATIYRYEKGEIADVPPNKAEVIAALLNTTAAYLTGKLERDLLALDIEIRYQGHGGVVLSDKDGEYGATSYSAERWLELQERDDFKTVWSDLTQAKGKPTPASEDGLSEEKRKLIEAVKTMSDEDARKLRVIVDQVILLRGE